MRAHSWPARTGLLLGLISSCMLLPACGGGGGGAPVPDTAGNDAATTTTTVTSSTTTTLAPRTYSAGTAATWEQAQVFLPDTSAPVALDDIPKDKTYPVIIFLHGCGGLASDEHTNWASLLAAEGLLVVMPDSFARPGRQSNCGDMADGGGPYPQVHDMRLEEIDYAREQLGKQAWFDGKTLFLMGYSEGAIAAVRYPRDGFTGVIATSWTCTDTSYPTLQGIALPSATPLLTLMHEVDYTWYPTRAVQGDCGQYMAGRTDARSVIVAGNGHGTYGDAAARQAVMQFVRRLR